MAKGACDAEIYAQELLRRGYGRPMWSPELPTEGVRLGDVGCIRKDNGSFILLFNVFANQKTRNKNGTPKGFVPLELHATLIRHQDDFIQDKCIRSDTAKRVEGGASLGGGFSGIGGDGSYTYSLDTQRGAFLHLANSADTDSILPNKLCAPYIDRHYNSWCKFAESFGMDVEQMEGPHLVSGVVKASEWAVAAWSSKACSQEVTIRVDALEVAGASLSLSFSGESQASPAHRSGPIRVPRKGRVKGKDREQGKGKDQVIFLSRYMMKQRDLGVMRSIKITSEEGAGKKYTYRRLHAGFGSSSAQRSHDPQSDVQGASQSGGQGDSQSGGQEGSGGGGGEITKDEHDERSSDPVEDLLDYILEHSDVDRAIACEGDLRDVLGIGPGVEFPGDVKAKLMEIAPIIDTCGNKAGIVSVEDMVFKAQARRVGGSSKVSSVIKESSSSAVEDDSGTLTIVKTTTDRRTIRWPHTSFLEDFTITGIPCTPAISYDGHILAAGYEDTCVRLFDIEHGVLESTLDDASHKGRIRCVAFSPDGGFLVSGSVDGSILVWNVPKKDVFKTLEGLESNIWSLTVSPDGEDVVGGSADSTIGFWKLKDESKIPFAKSQGYLMAVQAVAYTQDGSYLVSCQGDDGIIYSRGGDLVARMEGHEGPIYSMDIPHRKQDNRAVTGSEDSTVRIWKVETGEELVTIQYHQKSVASVRFTLDDKRVISGSYDMTVSVHDSYSGDLYAVLQGHASRVESVAYFPRGDFIVSGAKDGMVLLWDAKTGELIAELKCHSDKVTSIQVSPDEENVITCSDDGTIRALNIVDVIRVL